jgi:hypothetical protein
MAQAGTDGKVSPPARIARRRIIGTFINMSYTEKAKAGGPGVVARALPPIARLGVG